MNPDDISSVWLAVGLLGQLFFSCRFLVQWIASERRKASIVPPLFWWFSIGGAACLLTYAIYRADPVFILGQSAGFVVYFRNIVLLRRQRVAGESV